MNRLNASGPDESMIAYCSILHFFFVFSDFSLLPPTRTVQPPSVSDSMNKDGRSIGRETEIRLSEQLEARMRLARATTNSAFACDVGSRWLSSSSIAAAMVCHSTHAQKGASGCWQHFRSYIDTHKLEHI